MSFDEFASIMLKAGVGPDKKNLKALFMAIDGANGYADIDKLRIKSLIVNQGMRLKRIKPRARGRADRITKPTCHIEIILTDEAI